MKRIVLCLCCLALLPPLAGCVSKAKADERVRAAYLAGQQHAATQFQMRGPTVTVVGEVRNTLLPWTAGLTLAQAVLAAEYFGASDPSEIIVARGDERIRIDPRSLLGGEDIPLQPRDVIELRR
jgi:hypothetical protein